MHKEEEKEAISGIHFINGDVACAEGAIASGCRFFAGYPITPATEIAVRMAERLPRIGGMFIQMEDELASSAAVLGASWAGRKSMTATSGPGFSLMGENIGLGIITETPCVIVDVMRGGPSTGLPTLVGQGDIMQARWGSHGVYEIIALAPASPQEMFNQTVKAFNLAETYRLPVIILADEVVGHMYEKVVIPQENNIETHSRRRPAEAKERYLPFKANSNLIPPMVNAGEGYRIHITGLTHDERGYPAINASAQEYLIRRLADKIRRNADNIVECVETEVNDAEVVVVAYGITARVAMQAVQAARKEGVRAGLIRLVTIWPFPEKRLRELAGRIKGFVVPEINYGQIVYEVERCSSGLCETSLVARMGGEIHTPQEILNAIKETSKASKVRHGKTHPIRIFTTDPAQREPKNSPVRDMLHPADVCLRTEMMPHIFCSGCGIGIALSSFIKAVEDVKVDKDKVVIVSGIGCAGRVAGYLNLDSFHTTHGRAIPFAIGLKLANPELNVVVFSGDGDLFSIGGNHFIHAARRNVDIKVICINNFNYGMTGGQSGPTTPYKAKTTTSPYGNFEHPFNLPYLAASSGAIYVARWTTLHSRQLRKAIVECFSKRGFTFIEVISPCPIGYGRPNRLGHGFNMMRFYRDNTMVRNGANPLDATLELGKPFIVGRFLDIEKPTFLDLYSSTTGTNFGEE